MAKAKPSKLVKKTTSSGARQSKSTKAAGKSISYSKSEFSQQLSVNKPSFSRDIKNPKVYIPLALILIAILLFVFRGLFIIAIVNGQPITRWSLDSQLEKQYGKQQVTSMVTQALILQEAANKNISVSDSDIQASVKQISDTLQKQGQTLDSALALRGMSKQEFMDQLKIQKIVEKVLGNQIAVSDKEVQDYIDKNKDSLPTGVSDADLKVQVKQQLQQQKLTEKAQAWIADLQKKAKINYIVNF